MNTPQEPLSERVMKSISDGTTSMRSHWRERSRYIAGYLVLGVAVLFLVYVVSLIMFEIIARHLLWLPAMSPRGTRTLFGTWPWILTIILVCAMAIVEFLSRRLLPTYRFSLLASVVCTAIIVGLVGWSVGRSPLHPFLSERAHRTPWGVAVPLYAHRMDSPEHTFIGEVTSSDAQGFRMHVLRPVEEDDDVHVVITPETHLFPPKSPKEGQTVFVVGDRSGDEIRADGVRVVPPDEPFRPRPNPMRRGRRMLAPQMRPQPHLEINR